MRLIEINYHFNQKQLTQNKYITYQNLLFSILIISGSIKPFLIYYGFPVDLTLLVLILIGFDVITSIFLRSKTLTFPKVPLFYFFVLLSLFLLSIASVFYSLSFTFPYKLFEFTICIIAFFYPFFIVKIKPKVLYKTLLFVALPIAVWYIVFKYIYHLDINDDYTIVSVYFKEVVAGNYLGLGTTMSFLGLLCIKYSKRKALILFFVTIILLGLGSRGSLLFLYFTLIVFYYKELFKKTVKISRKKLKIFASFLSIVLLTVIYFYHKFIDIAKYGLSRFEYLFQPSTDASLQGRFEHYEFAIEKIFTLQGFTVGYGIGGFERLFYIEHGQKIAYPHNIFLEAWFELGLLGILLLGCFTITPLFLKRETYLKTLAFYCLLSALKSSSFTNDRPLYAIFAILIFMIHYERKTV